MVSVFGVQMCSKTCDSMFVHTIYQWWKPHEVFRIRYANL